MWKKLRVAILLVILASVGLGTWRSQHAARDWHNTLHIAVFPINGDGSPATAARIATLDDNSFKDIETFLSEQAEDYGNKTAMPVRVTLQKPVSSLPPSPPQGGSALNMIIWSLKMRWWAWHQPDGVPRAHTRAFVIYWDSEKTDGAVPDSHGLSKGMIAVSNVHIARNMQRTNNVVIAHEILHTLGATDKYGPSLMPSYPEGFADPDLQPRFPQKRCELMAGRIPLSDSQLAMPRTLDECIIGPLTAREIGMVP